MTTTVTTRQANPATPAVRIPFVDLKAQYHSIREEVRSAIDAVLEKTDFILGEDVRRLEAEFAEFCGTAHAVSVSSGTEALRLALLACGIGPGDEVITAANTYVGTVEAIAQAGATPILADVSPATYNLDADAVERALTPRTKALLPVHLYGQPADMDALSSMATRRSLRVIEDACQAHGALYRGRRAGSLGDLGCFSFYPSKNLGAYGDGGMITTNNRDYAEWLRLSRTHGEQAKNRHTLKGSTSRLDTLQAAVLRVKLRHLPAWNEARRRHAAQYRQRLEKLGIAGPVESPGVEHVYHVFAVEVEHRGRLQQHLQDQGIQTGVHYPVPVFDQEAFAELRAQAPRCPVTARAVTRLVSLPMYAELRDEHVDEVVDQIARFYQRSAGGPA